MATTTDQAKAEVLRLLLAPLKLGSRWIQCERGFKHACGVNVTLGKTYGAEVEVCTRYHKTDYGRMVNVIDFIGTHRPVL